MRTGPNGHMSFRRCVCFLSDYLLVVILGEWWLVGWLGDGRGAGEMWWCGVILWWSQDEWLKRRRRDFYMLYAMDANFLLDNVRLAPVR